MRGWWNHRGEQLTQHWRDIPQVETSAETGRMRPNDWGALAWVRWRPEVVLGGANRLCKAKRQVHVQGHSLAGVPGFPSSLADSHLSSPAGTYLVSEIIQQDRNGAEEWNKTLSPPRTVLINLPWEEHFTTCLLLTSPNQGKLLNKTKYGHRCDQEGELTLWLCL